jgi:hypothetical protein
VSFEEDRPLLHPLLAARWSPAAFDAVPDHWEVTTMAAVGRPAAASAGPTAPESFATVRRADVPSRQRRSIDDILWPVA